MVDFVQQLVCVCVGGSCCCIQVYNTLVSDSGKYLISGHKNITLMDCKLKCCNCLLFEVTNCVKM